MEWDYSCRKGRDGQQEKTSKANERKIKVNRGKDEEVNGQGGKEGCPGPTGGLCMLTMCTKMHNMHTKMQCTNVSNLIYT